MQSRAKQVMRDEINRLNVPEPQEIAFKLKVLHAQPFEFLASVHGKWEIEHTPEGEVLISARLQPVGAAPQGAVLDKFAL